MSASVDIFFDDRHTLNRVENIRTLMRDAALKAGREPEVITLMAVSKKFPVLAITTAWRAGIRDFGENYANEGVEKIQALRHNSEMNGVRWHFIGAIQSNKTGLIASHFDWVHTIDRLKTAQRLSAQRPSNMAALQVCIQVNIDGSNSKSGVHPEDLKNLADAIARLPNVRLRGLMCIPDAHETYDDQLDLFSRMAELQTQLCSAGHDLDTLSMGMSADFEAAIAAGSTLVRIGSAIFGQRKN